MIVIWSSSGSTRVTLDHLNELIIVRTNPLWPRSNHKGTMAYVAPNMYDACMMYVCAVSVHT
jgi:hypothetical protein